jgi:catechol 2,3-dioxygenase-like lactoylglutathione lyase family enzyme
MAVLGLSDYGRCAFGSGGAASPAMCVNVQLYRFCAAVQPSADRRRRARTHDAFAMINIRSLDHVVLRVADMERACRFYVEVLGCRVEKRQDDIGLVQLRAGLSLIDLADMNGTIGREGGAAPADEGRNLDHFCVRVEPWDERAILAWLGEHDVSIGEVASRYGAEGQGPSIYLFDPDGNKVELKGPPALPMR